MRRDIISSGLVLYLDAGVKESGTASHWYDLTPNNVTTTDVSISYTGLSYNFNGLGYVDFTAPNLSTTTTVEMFCKIKTGYAEKMLFGWSMYDIWCSGGSMGYNTGAGDVYGISSARVTALGLVNKWVHYVFEMRGDVLCTNNKMYINSKRETLSQIQGTPTIIRNFNGGMGRIACWRNDLSYLGVFECAVFRVYNRALTQAEITQNYNSTKARTMPHSSYVVPAGLHLQPLHIGGTLLNVMLVVKDWNLSGTVKYANPWGVTSSSTNQIVNSTVYLKTTDGSTILKTTSVDNFGNFSFDVRNGSYMLTATTTLPWDGSSGIGGCDTADVSAIGDYVNTGVPALTGIYFTSGDINRNANINSADKSLLNNRIKTYSVAGWPTDRSTDWIFNSSIFTINNNTISNADVIGILRGDVNGSYVPPLFDVSLNAKVFLQGPYNPLTSLMVAAKPVTPTSQPYNVAPWNYTGTESVVSIPANVTDWILVELRRDASSSAVDRKAGFLMRNGTICDMDGVNPLTFNILKIPHYIIIRHRNHLSIMSATTHNLESGVYDFTTGLNKAYGAVEPMEIASDNATCMIAGDVNNDGIVNIDDLSLIEIDVNNFVEGYTYTNLNGDDFVDGTDMDIITHNNLSGWRVCQVP